MLRRTLALLSLATISMIPTTTAGASCTGSWTALPIRSDHHPEGVAAISQDDAWLVAWDSDPDEPSQGFAYRWDGSAWTRVPIPESSTGTWPRDVAAISTDDVWIVGRWYQTSWSAYAAHWDGAHVTSVPIDAGRFAELHAVDGVAPDDVWAVGAHWVRNHYRPVTVHWDGIGWSEVPIPQLERATGILSDVEAIAPDDVWAVGVKKLPRELGRPLALHWDGVSWSKTGAGPTGSFNSVAATPGGRVWAVGARDRWILAERWNGSSWKVMPSPHAGGYGHGTWLEGVSAVSGDEVWAAGSADLRASLFRWDGAEWHAEEVLPRAGGSIVSVDSLPSGVSFAAGTTNRSDILALGRCPAV